MPDDTQTGGQAPAGTQGQAPNAAQQTPANSDPTNTQANAQQPQAGSGDNGQQATSASGDSELAKRLERMEKELADTRKEAANYRTKARELDKLREDEANAKLDDVQKAQKRAEDAEKRINSFRTRIGASELKLAAKEAGIIDPDDAIAHLMGKLEFDDNGEPKDVAELVKGLKGSKPHLFAAAASPASAPAKPAASAGGATNPPRTSAPLTVTANQYLDKAFQQQFRATHGMDVLTAVRQGKATLI